MLRRAMFAGAVCLALAAFGGLSSGAAPEGPKPAQEAPKLPITKVILYKHGVGYFERARQGDRRRDVTLRFKAHDMSDLLKSLTVLDLERRRRSRDRLRVHQDRGPAARRVHVQPPRGAQGLPAILEQMKGSEVALRVARSDVRGRILSVEKRIECKDELRRLNRTGCPLLMAAGAVKTFDLTEVSRHPVHRRAACRRTCRSYLTTLFSRHRRDEKEADHPGRAKERELLRLVRAGAAGVEGVVPARAEREGKAAAPGVGDCGQRERARIGSTSRFAGQRAAGVVRAGPVRPAGTSSARWWRSSARGRSPR